MDTFSDKEKEKALYLKQIQFLDKELERSQLTCSKLEKQNEKLINECNQQDEVLKDICEYLHCAKAKKEKETEELAKQLEGEKQTAEQNLKDLKLQQSREIEELQEQLNKLNSDFKLQAAQIEELQKEKEQLKQELCGSSGEMEEQKAAMKSLRKELSSETERVAEEIIKATNEYAEKRISEIVQKERALLAEYQQQSHLMLSTMKDLLVKRDNLERSLKKHSDEHDSLKKHAVKMKQEVSYDEERLEGLKRKCEQHMSRLENYRLYQESKLTQLEDLRQQVASASEEYDQKSGHVAQVEAELQRERNREQQLESDMKKAASILRRIVMASEEKEKTELLLRVQKVLERDLPEDIDSTLTHYILTSCGGNTPQTTDAELTREETVKMATDPLFLLARSRPGDLGIIPRPSWEQ